MDYEKLLQRARKNLPATAVEERRFELPKFESFIEGAKTIIKNFIEVAKNLGRDPAHLLKFLQAETGTFGEIEDQRLVLKGPKKVEVLNEKLDLYIKEFVLCKECKKPDTEIRKVEHIDQVKCKACGAKYTVRKL
ncbi:TPA: translation initiation factor IF-2 subunit beta [archaeon]|uniref:Translation initiation factor 2 subunit beta n=1 Tax=Candidatus Naiadarchaeum limnaeum TaxID=2756139 RepID=A0A832XGE3_9ARCH|nr:translation initiation factor IF-2 subunit beta [Candidatus Naiadarchaeum limnaeum]